MTRWIALLRGVNVGGHRKVPMARLREVVADLGHRDVATYVQSGNVVFTGPDDGPAEVAAGLEEGLAGAFGFEVQVVLRTRDELAGVVGGDPLRDVATDPAKHLVVFLAREIGADRLAGLDPDDIAPEVLRVSGREIHLWCPGGLGRSPVGAALTERRLGVLFTARNWRTVQALLAMADKPG